MRAEPVAHCSGGNWSVKTTVFDIAGVIADMAEDLNDAELSLVEQQFISAGLL